MAAPSPRPAPSTSRWETVVPAAVLILAILAAYHTTFAVPFLFDDLSSILGNSSIRDLRAFGAVLNPPTGEGLTVGGRPVMNLSLALCYAMGGTDVGVYHAFNLIVHGAAALTLFGIVRRTWSFLDGSGPRLPETAASSPVREAAPVSRHGPNATWIGFTVALLWALHPLQTESVTYIIQRAESLMGLFCFLTVYGFIRSVSAPSLLRWRMLMVVSCLLGVGTKEVTAVVPVLLFLYDRTFVAGSFREAWRLRRWLHLSLVATWLPLLGLVAATGWDRGGTFTVGSPVAYWLTQFQAVVHYLRLSFWPHPLVFAYPTYWSTFAEAAPYAVPVFLLLGATAVALWRWPAAGFLGAWFFLILAPTSLAPGTIQMIVEHRMYLPLAAVIAGTVALAVRMGGTRALLLFIVPAVAAGVATERRNRTYESDLSLWQDTVEKRPDSAIAQNSFGTALYLRGRVPEALVHFENAARLSPTNARVHYNLGLALLQANRPAEAAARFGEAVRLAPGMGEAHYQFGVALYHLNRAPEAAARFARALEINPELNEAHFSLGLALTQMGRIDEALQHHTEAARLNPQHIGARLSAGQLLAQTGRSAEAVLPLEEALRLQPQNARAHLHLGIVLARLNRLAEAVSHLEESVRIDPSASDAHGNLGLALLQSGRAAEAAASLQESVRLRPENPVAHYGLANALIALSRPTEAEAHLEEALRLEPRFAPARERLDQLRSR